MKHKLSLKFAILVALLLGVVSLIFRVGLGVKYSTGFAIFICVSFYVLNDTFRLGNYIYLKMDFTTSLIFILVRLQDLFQLVFKFGGTMICTVLYIIILNLNEMNKSYPIQIGFIFFLAVSFFELDFGFLSLNFRRMRKTIPAFSRLVILVAGFSAVDVIRLEHFS